MNDFNLKFYQCFGCNGYGKYEDVIWDFLRRGYCKKLCKKEYGITVYGYSKVII